MRELEVTYGLRNRIRRNGSPVLARRGNSMRTAVVYKQNGTGRIQIMDAKWDGMYAISSDYKVVDWTLADSRLRSLTRILEYSLPPMPLRAWRRALILCAAKELEAIDGR